jgi:hypothetical protein
LRWRNFTTLRGFNHSSSRFATTGQPGLLAGAMQLEFNKTGTDSGTDEY